MADNRQFADHDVVGGVNVYYEDKKLAESPSQSSVASNDYFVLKDTDGVPHKIVKADVLEMVRDAMGTILANNNKGTSVTKVPTLGSSGNDFGSSSVADLASVLGVRRYTIEVNGSCQILGDSLIVMDYNGGSATGIIVNAYDSFVNIREFTYASYSCAGNNIVITNTSAARVTVLALPISM